MALIPEYTNIFRYTLDALDKSELSRADLIVKVLDAFSLDEKQLDNRTRSEKVAQLRASIGAVLNEMEKKGVILYNSDGTYSKKEEKTVAIRMVECERKIISYLRGGMMTKDEIRARLVSDFSVLSTESEKDDNRLYTYMGQILKRMVTDGTLSYDGSVYAILPEKHAHIKKKAEVLALKSEFLAKIHSRGGEFFEYFFMNLLSRYLIRCGKTVLEGYVTGGSADGGIDCIIKTQDSLGFRETVMVQTKNRSETVTETDVRGFYGAVCAKRGSRGIYATVSDFHPMADKLLSELDDCVGINGDKIFAMACDTSYGIRRDGENLVIDENII